MATLCPHCGYDLRGLPAGRCPECGFGYDHEGLRALEQDAKRHRAANDEELIGHALLIAAILIFSWGEPDGLAILLFLPKGLLILYALARADVLDLNEAPRNWWLLPLYSSGYAGCMAAAFVLMVAPPVASLLASGVALRMVVLESRQPARATYEPDPVNNPQPAYRLKSTKARLCYAGALAWVVLSWVALAGG